MKVILIDPAYDVFKNNKLFEVENYQDHTMAEPFVRLRDHCLKNGVDIATIDFLDYYLKKSAEIKIWSFGNFKSLESYLGKSEIDLAVLMIVEPPMINPKIYNSLAKFEQYFKKIYLYNDDFIRKKEKYSQFKFFQPAITEQELLNISANKLRLKRYVMISSNLRPRKSCYQELYSMRIEVMLQLGRLNLIDLYGRGWRKIIGRSCINPLYLLNYFEIGKYYRGVCETKYDILSNYDFSIVFENMIMDGYVTEKIFDAMRAGCIPIYLGAPNINQIIPKDCFIDFRDYSTIEDLNNYCINLSASELLKYRTSIVNYLSHGFKNFQDSLIEVCDELLADW